MRYNDILAYGSGLSHIGVNGGRRDVFDHSLLLPFGHIHQNSGVFHDPLMGESGVLRYSRAAAAFQLSVDGGLTFQNVQVGDYSGVLGVNGVSVTQTGRNFVVDAASLSGLIRPSGGIGGIDGQIGPHIELQGVNGVQVVVTAANVLTIDAASLSGNIGTPNHSGVYGVNGIVVEQIGGNFIVDAAALSGLITASVNNSGVVGVNGIDVQQIGGRFVVDAASLSGYFSLSTNLQAAYNNGDEINLTSRPGLTPRGILLKYPVGARTPKPNDAINVEPGYGVAVSGFSPTPDNLGSYAIAILAPNALAIRGSGQNSPNLWLGVDNLVNAAKIQTSGVLMVSGGSGTIFNNTVTFIGATAGGEITLSGLYTRPTNLMQGDLYMMAHGNQTTVAGLTDPASIAARSLGIGTLNIATGSGSINISVGSGICMYAQTLKAAQQVVSAVNTDVDFDTCQIGDQNYVLLANTTSQSGAIAVMSPGLYKVTYSVGLQKTAGATAQTVSVIVAKNGAQQIGGFAYANFDTTSSNLASCGNSFILNLNAGDTIRVRLLSSLAGANNVNLVNNTSNIMIEKIGPTRGAF